MDTRIHNPLKLPKSLRTLIECIGEEAALRLIEWRGGAYLCVPGKVDPSHPLLDHIGGVAFAKLVYTYAGETITLVKNDAVLRQIKHAMIRQMRYQQNIPIDQIAIKIGYTTRRVFQVLAEDDAPTNGTLF